MRVHLLTLQVKEHLELFAILKGAEEDTLETVIINMADEVRVW
jgi:hypothetical protein